MSHPRCRGMQRSFLSAGMHNKPIWIQSAGPWLCKPQELPCPGERRAQRAAAVMRNSELMAIKSLQSFPGAPGSGRAGLHLDTDTGLIKGSQLPKPLGSSLGTCRGWAPRVSVGTLCQGRLCWKQPPPHSSHSCSVLGGIGAVPCTKHSKVGRSHERSSCYKPCEKCKVFCEYFWA